MRLLTPASLPECTRSARDAPLRSLLWFGRTGPVVTLPLGMRVASDSVYAMLYSPPPELRRQALASAACEPPTTLSAGGAAEGSAAEAPPPFMWHAAGLVLNSFGSSTAGSYGVAPRAPVAGWYEYAGRD